MLSLYECIIQTGVYEFVLNLKASTGGRIIGVGHVIDMVYGTDADHKCVTGR